jgi:hypothetical protein
MFVKSPLHYGNMRYPVIPRKEGDFPSNLPAARCYKYLSA